MILSLVVALDRNGLIGKDNQLPWRLPADLRHFKAVTMGKPIIMGRKTCQSIGRPLPGRQNLVLSRDPAFTPEGFEVYHEAGEVLEAVQSVEEACVIGGAEIYRIFLPLACRAYITLVDASVEGGDAWFPEWPLGPSWQAVTSELRPADEKNAWAMTFLRYEKMEIR